MGGRVIAAGFLDPPFWLHIHNMTNNFHSLCDVFFFFLIVENPTI